MPIKTVNAICSFFILLLSSLFVAKANAIMISLETSDDTINVGEATAIDIIISDLGFGFTPSLSAFDIEISFDGSTLDLDSVTFGTDLDVFGLGSLQDSTISSNSVSLYEISFDSDIDLDLSQPDSFSLGSLIFSGQQAGSAQLDIDILALSNTEGRLFDANTTPLVLTVNNNDNTGSSISEPHHLALFMLLFIPLIRKRNAH
ncbi:hypothetical protein BIZ37_09345 [Photobacterium sp. BZF1]|uniref:hypothetical protein n=1 Tax=Photobacterium sp. BZF1 TaxID=1904457 RepID=UPI001653A5EF|nr:hypothetical protein [Photobacterium sp. BZF1]MBC7002759.1 hypothetical protein [Photobacterium sp. BZF1]